MKTVYQYDVAGIYIGPTTADESPREPGVFLVPARCTTAVPPAEFPEGRWPRWNGSTWDLVTRPRPASPEPAADPVAKLRAFLEQNPDVAALVSPAQDQP